MANKFTRFLGEVLGGALAPKGNMANWQHATRLFVDNNYAFAPRTKFMYYVYFELDASVAGATQFKARHGDMVGMLVKSLDLPKYTFDHIVKNQYNKKKICYKDIKYDPVNIAFHDDNTGVVNALWALYYGTYIADRNLDKIAFSTNELYSSSKGYAYGFDTGRWGDFIRSVTLYTMSRQRYNGYTLVNPKILSWQHGTMGSSETGVAESTMQLGYEAVLYSSGVVKQGLPDGFGNNYYDKTPSPLTIGGGGTASIFGEGGTLAGISTVFGNVSDGTAFKSFGGFLSTTVAAINTAKNFEAAKANFKNEALNIITSPAAIDGALNVVSGLPGTLFPKNSNVTPDVNGAAIPAYKGADVPTNVFSNPGAATGGSLPPRTFPSAGGENQG